MEKRTNCPTFCPEIQTMNPSGTPTNKKIDGPEEHIMLVVPPLKPVSEEKSEFQPNDEQTQDLLMRLRNE